MKSLLFKITLAACSLVVINSSNAQKTKVSKYQKPFILLVPVDGII